MLNDQFSSTNLTIKLEHSNFQTKKYDLEERAAKFAENIIDLVKKIPLNPINKRIIEQLVGSGGSMGANYCEANETENSKIRKLKINTYLTKFFLTLPWIKDAAPTSIPIKNTSPNIDSNLGALISGFANIAFMVGGFLMLFWLSWGVFQYIFASGDKEKLARARARLTWAIIGFVFLIVMFFVSDYLKTIYTPQLPGGVTTVTEPGGIRPGLGGTSGGDSTPAKEGCTDDVKADCRVGTVCKVANGDPYCVDPGSSHSPLCSNSEIRDCEDAKKICKVVSGDKQICVDK